MDIEYAGGRVRLLNRAGAPRSTALPLTLDREQLAANRIVGFDPPSERVQPFIMMRSLMLRHVEATGQRVFAITSVEPGNGKTHVAVNLAAALSRIHPTTLIEFDMRRSAIGDRLGLAPSLTGVDDYLRGEARWRETRLNISGYDLAVHRVRQTRQDAEVLLNSPRLGEALELVRSSDERPICIIDTPPALVSDDLMLIARHIDGVLLVVEEARTRKRGLADVVSALAPKPVVASILNMTISDPIPGAGYGYYAEDDQGRAE